jgi:hypothetical protein
MDQRGSVFDLAVKAADCGLAIAFNHLAASGRIKGHAGQQGARIGGDLLDAGFQIFDIAPAGPGVPHDRRRRDELQRLNLTAKSGYGCTPDIVARHGKSARAAARPVG